MAETIIQSKEATAPLEAKEVLAPLPGAGTGESLFSPREMSDDAFEQHLQKVLRVHERLLAKLAE